MKFLHSVLVLLCVMGSGSYAQRTCYSCDSESNANCASLRVLPLPSKACEDPNEVECAVTVFGQRTIRGCKSEVDALFATSCSSDSCGLCVTDLCNNAIYPENRLQCHQCSTCDYIENNSKLGACENYHETDFCYVVVDQVLNPESATIDIISNRGCYSTQDEGLDYCISHPEKCPICSTDGCNSAPTYTDSKLKCHKCDTATDPSCKYSQTSKDSQLCDYNILFGVPEFCYTYTKEDGEVVRGCLMELSAGNEIRKNCEAGDEGCRLCAGSDCNQAATDNGECVTCHGSTDPNCALLEEPYTVAKCGPSDAGGCYRANIGGVIVRSCVADLPEEDIEYCKNGANCKICEGDMCNAKVDFAVCHKCDSRTDPDCSEYQTNDAITCSDYLDSCAAYIDLPSGATIRGCKKEMIGYSGCPEGNNYCVDCDRSYCNAAAIPWWRVKCHQCNGLECASTSWTTAKYCSDYMDNEECFSVMGIVDGEAQVYRGCMSDEDPNPGKQLCAAEGDNCSKCSRSECNSEVIKTYGQCYYCDGTKDPNCASLTDVFPILCPKGEKEGCFHSRIDGVNVRGCISQLLPGEVAVCEKGTQCKICEEDNCNKNENFQSCFVCNSLTNPASCIAAQSSTGTARKATCSDYLDQCVTYTENGVTHRGCRKELDIPEKCPSCAFCSGSDCNSFVATAPSELECHVCDSTTDPNCTADKSSGVPTLCGYSLVIGRVDQCYTHKSQDKISRGCLHDAPFDVQLSCNVGGEECELCGASGCNAKEVETYGQCYFCDGITDDNCADLNGLSPIYCPKGEQKGCFRSEVDGVVVRGCISQLLPGETSLCASGKQCKTCEGDNCNGKIEFQSCYACNSLTNPRCFLSQTSTNTQAVCADYLDDCVTYTVNGITTRGCKKDVEIPATCPSCSYCSTENCNAYVATVPSELSCHVCDPTDPNCKADKSSDPSIRCDYSLVVGREDQCFLYQNEDKITRGCLQNAPFDIQWACISGTGECSLCGTSGCNSEEVELNGYCYFCDGVTDSNCAALTGVPSVYCPKGENKGCFRSQIDGVIVRGCISQLLPGEAALCATGRQCKTCQGDHCNGKLEFQSCYACNSLSNPQCIFSQTSSETARKSICSDYLDECVTYTDEGVTYRGCSKDLILPTDCPGCSFCNTADCNGNIATVPSELLCHVCDASTDPNCKKDQSNDITTICNYNLIVGRVDQCYVYHDGEKFSRGCLHNAPFDVQLSCSLGEDECKVCTTSGCNAEAIESYGECYFCDGVIDSNCANLIEVPSISCPKGDTKGCFRSQIDGFVVRGCISQLLPGEAARCTIGRDCKTCEGDNCNGKLEFQSCYTCNSASDPNCLEIQDPNKSVKTTCSSYLDACVTYIDAGVTYRGCAKQSQLPAGCSSTTCSECSNGDCNGLIFPTNRIKCHHCSGAANECVSGQTSAATQLSVCKNYIAGDACYTTVTTDKSSVYRGCMSDADRGSQLCSQNGDVSCSRCLTTACNAMPAVSPASLSCVKCSTSSDGNCGWAYETTNAAKCEKNVWIGEKESCYAAQSTVGVSRGCTLDDLDTCRENCDSCSTNGCNTKSYNKFKCYQCSSNVAGQESCAKEVEGLLVTECPGDNQKPSELGCYLWKKDDQTVERGCLCQLDASIKNECKDGESAACKFCEGEGCNNQNGGAAALAALSTVALILIAMVVGF